MTTVGMIARDLSVLLKNKDIPNIEYEIKLILERYGVVMEEEEETGVYNGGKY